MQHYSGWSWIKEGFQSQLEFTTSCKEVRELRETGVFSNSETERKLWKYRPKRSWESTSGALPRSLLLAMTAIPNHLAPQSLEGLPWYAIQTRYRFERKAAAQLQNKGIETFLPVIEESHRWSDRQK